MNIKATIKTLTPLMAAEYLEKNNINRKIAKSRIAFYASEMLNNDWTLNGEGIIISDKGNLLDGQHRLHAIIKSNKFVQMLLVEGVDESTFDTIDTGDKRTPADVLTTKGFAPREAMMIARAISIELSMRAGSLTLSPVTIKTAKSSPRSILRIAEDEPEFLIAAEFIADFPAKTLPLSSAILTFLSYRFFKFDEEFSRDWLTGFITGANLSADEPRMMVRNKLARDVNSIAKLPPRVRMAYAILAWKIDIKGKKVTTPQFMRRLTAVESAAKAIRVKTDGK